MTNFESFEKYDEIECARDQVRLWLEQGIMPVITVPRQYVPALKNGIRESSSWIGGNIIAGTIGRDPYMPSGEDRVMLRVSINAPEQLEPRMTGPDRSFHGVVVFHGPIMSNQIEILS